jgi:hypothetical protein
MGDDFDQNQSLNDETMMGICQWGKCKSESAKK